MPARLQRDKFTECVDSPSFAAAVQSAATVSKKLMVSRDERNTEMSAWLAV